MYTFLNAAVQKPAIWSAYTAEKLWTDSHIARQMLRYHLDPEVNAASRSIDVIEQSVDFFVATFDLGKSSRVIDFGCGPGLYTHALKTRGIGSVTGVDFSAHSLNYAKVRASEERLEITYQLANYLDYCHDDCLDDCLDDCHDYRRDSRYDVISLIMSDFCALNPQQRTQLLAGFKRMLKPNGVVLLDVYTLQRFANLNENVTLERNSMSHFWSSQDYWCIQSSHRYLPEKVGLDKYCIVQDDNQWFTYNWLQHFNIDDLQTELANNGLQVVSIYDDFTGKPYTNSQEMALVITHKYVS